MKGVLSGLTAFFALMSILCTSSILVVLLLLAWEGSQLQEPRTPGYLMYGVINPDVVATLCRNDAVPISIADCSNDNLQLQFWQIRDIVESYVENNLTHDELTELIGDYEVACNLPDSRPLPNTFRCAYQFNVGYTLVFVFDDVTEQLLAIE